MPEPLVRLGGEGSAVPGAVEAARLARIDLFGAFGAVTGSSSLRSAMTRMALDAERRAGRSGDFGMMGDLSIGIALCGKSRGKDQV